MRKLSYIYQAEMDHLLTEAARRKVIPKLTRTQQVGKFLTTVAEHPIAQRMGNESMAIAAAIITAVLIHQFTVREDAEKERQLADKPKVVFHRNTDKVSVEDIQKEMEALMAKKYPQIDFDEEKKKSIMGNVIDALKARVAKFRGKQ